MLTQISISQGTLPDEQRWKAEKTAIILLYVTKRLTYLAGVINTVLSLLAVKSSAVPEPA